MKQMMALLAPALHEDVRCKLQSKAAKQEKQFNQQLTRAVPPQQKRKMKARGKRMNQTLATLQALGVLGQRER